MTQSRRADEIRAALFGLDFRAPVALDERESGTGPVLSIIAPMYDEIGGAVDLIEEITAALGQTAYEIIVVDDASTDGTAQALAARLTRADAPLDLAMVAGERRARMDVASKKTASRLANWVRGKLLNDGAADTGCGLKAFYRTAYLRLPYFDHAHRYLPALMRREGFAVEFEPVGHRPRAHGRSKYTNLGRLGVAFRDLQGVLWLKARARSPEWISEVQPERAYASMEPND